MTPRLATLLLGLSTLGACASVPAPEGPPVATAADRHAITVDATSQRMAIDVGESAELTHKARGDIQTFASQYLRYGHGALIVETYAGAGDSNNVARAANEARMALVEAGVPYESIAGEARLGSGGPAQIQLSFARFVATAPECAPLWEQDLAHQSNNQPWASFGCATQSNLAALVEDPHDLLQGRAETARDSGRRNTVMDRYRRGEPTHAERSADERSTVSTVAN